MDSNDKQGKPSLFTLRVWSETGLTIIHEVISWGFLVAGLCSVCGPLMPARLAYCGWMKRWWEMGRNVRKMWERRFFFPQGEIPETQQPVFPKPNTKRLMGALGLRVEAFWRISGAAGWFFILPLWFTAFLSLSLPSSSFLSVLFSRGLFLCLATLFLFLFLSFHYWVAFAADHICSVSLSLSLPFNFFLFSTIILCCGIGLCKADFSVLQCHVMIWIHVKTQKPSSEEWSTNHILASTSKYEHKLLQLYVYSWTSHLRTPH